MSDVVIIDPEPEVILVSDRTIETVVVSTGEVGPPGPPGPPGEPGPPGDPGTAGGLVLADVRYVYTQAIPADIWIINHSLNFQPNVTVVDSAGTAVEGAVQYLDLHTIQVAFSAGFSGTAYLT